MKIAVIINSELSHFEARFFIISAFRSSFWFSLAMFYLITLRSFWSLSTRIFSSSITVASYCFFLSFSFFTDYVNFFFSSFRSFCFFILIFNFSLLIFAILFFILIYALCSRSSSSSRSWWTETVLKPFMKAGVMWRSSNKTNVFFIFYWL